MQFILLYILKDYACFFKAGQRKNACFCGKMQFKKKQNNY